MKHTIITIGRQFGSGGREIAQKLSRLLEIPFYDKELIEVAAKESGMHQDVVKNIDETASHSLLYSLSTGSFILGGRYSPLTDAPINDKLYFIQSDIIRHIADEGSCIIVGRCADYILRERPELLNLFIYAPLEERIKRISDLYDLTPNKAKEKIMKTDKRRNTYYHYYSDRKWGDLENYHCSVDSSMLGVDGTVKFLAELAKQKEASLEK